MYCSVLCRDSDWNSSHEGACHYTRHTYMDPHYKVLDLNDTQIPPAEAYSNLFNCILQRMIQFIGVQKIKDAVNNNEPMQSWSANDPRTRGFRDGKFATMDLEALLSLEDNFDKIDAHKMNGYAGVKFTIILKAAKLIYEPEYLFNSWQLLSLDCTQSPPLSWCLSPQSI